MFFSSKKVFAVVDVDGSGSINSKELAKVIYEITKEEPTPSELNMLMRKMDANNDGTISWNEFLQAMTEWFADEDKVVMPTIGTKRKEHPTAADVRTKIHKRIQGFFKQYKKSTDFDQIRAKLLAQVQDHKTSDGDADDYTGTLTPQERLARVEKSREYLQFLADIASGISSNDVEVALKCTTGLADILSVVEVRILYPTFFLRLYNNITNNHIYS